MVPPETHTQPRQIRIRDDTWDRFAVAAEAAGVDRSTIIRKLIEWYLHDPATPRLPKRPERPTDAQLDTWREQHPARRKRHTGTPAGEPGGTASTEQARDGRNGG